VDPSELERQKQDLEAKYKTFLNAYKTTEPAHPESLRKLEDLKGQVDRKNAVLETLQAGLKEFELEMILRSGTVNKQRRLEREKSAAKKQELS